jgi:hypothetical protein
MIYIVNLKVTKPSQPYDAKIDRSSPLGNLFHMSDESQRDEVCDKYDVWLKQMIEHRNMAVCNELNRLYNLYKKHKGLRLFCWCAPKRCHGLSIQKVLMEKIERRII